MEAPGWFLGHFLETMRTKQQIKDFIMINHHLETISEMAKELGLGYHAVELWCARLGVTPVTKESRVKDALKDHPGKTIDEYVVLTGSAKDTITKYAKELGIVIKRANAACDTTQEDDKEVEKNIALLGARMGYISEFKVVEREPGVYTQGSSPYGLADEVKGIKTKK
jgi:hypothetical protein